MSSATLLFIEIYNASMNTVRPKCIHYTCIIKEQMLETVLLNTAQNSPFQMQLQSAY